MTLTIASAMPRKKYGPTSFGERLVAIRKDRGLTQAQLAEAAGTTQRAISYYETEAGFPAAPAIIDLAKALRVSTDELLGVQVPSPLNSRPISCSNNSALARLPPSFTCSKS